MAVVFMDGFDHYGNIDDSGDAEFEANQWTSAVLINGTVVGSRFTSYPGRMMKSTSTGGQVLTKAGLSSTNCVVGFATYEWVGWANYNSDGTAYLIQLRSNSPTEPLIGNLCVDANGYLFFQMWDYDLGTPGWVYSTKSTNQMNLSTWYYIELVYTGATGAVVIYIDGVEWLNSATEGAPFMENTVNIVKLQAQDHAYFDDVYITDDNTKLDAPRIITLYPNEAGTETGWNGTWRELEASGGFTESIDEEYISSSTSLNKESWKYNELPPGSWDIHAVGPALRCKNNGAGTPTLKVTCKNGVNTPNTTGISVQNDFTHMKHIELYKVGTTDWDEAAVNDIEVIVEYE